LILPASVSKLELAASFTRRSRKRHRRRLTPSTKYKRQINSPREQDKISGSLRFEGLRIVQSSLRTPDEFVHSPWTITLFATAGIADFVENSLEGICRCGIEPSIVQVVFPANAESELSPLASHFGVRPRLLETLLDGDIGQFPSTYVNYGTTEFNRLMQVRFPLIRRLLLEGERMIVADVDVAWIRNPLPYLSKVLDHYPWAIQTEALDLFPPDFCVGFFALRNASECLEVIDAHIARFADARREGITMQRLFNQIVAEHPERLREFFPLPEALFANGMLHTAVRAAADAYIDRLLVSHLRPFIFHANFVVGLANKRALLHSVGCWTTEEACCDQSFIEPRLG
jgi:Nucleotide-diphospho-sugar transferase